MGEGDVHNALRKLTRALDAEKIPYAIIGAMALNEFGYRRQTTDVDVLMTRDGFARFKAAWLGRGWVEKFPGSKGLRDPEHNVGVDVVLTGEYPGDGKPKPISFPDPAVAAIRGREIAVLPVEKIVELKLASGLSASHRLKDLADVLELIRHAKLPESLGDSIDASVREKYRELWQAAQGAPDE